jgi:hypothetical protein
LFSGFIRALLFLFSCHLACPDRDLNLNALFKAATTPLACSAAPASSSPRILILSQKILLVAKCFISCLKWICGDKSGGVFPVTTFCLQKHLCHVRVQAIQRVFYFPSLAKWGQCGITVLRHAKLLNHRFKLNTELVLNTRIIIKLFKFCDGCCAQIRIGINGS